VRETVEYLNNITRGEYMYIPSGSHILTFTSVKIFTVLLTMRKQVCQKQRLH